MICKELDIKTDFHYSALKVLPSYIQNQNRIFCKIFLVFVFVFAPNHVKLIHDTIAPSQCRYINSASNPVDLATPWYP